MYKVLLILVLLPIVSFARLEGRTKVCVIDTGINFSKELNPYLCKDDHFDFTGNGIQDTIEHGTHISWILKKYLNKQTHCIKMFKAFTAPNENNMSRIVSALHMVVQDGCSYLNMSFGGYGYNIEEKKAMLDILKNNITVACSAGNEHKELHGQCNYYPICYNLKNNNFHSVGSGTKSQPDDFSNYGDLVSDWANGQNQCAGYKKDGRPICYHGTSQAAPNFLGRFIQKGQ